MLYVLERRDNGCIVNAGIYPLSDLIPCGLHHLVMGAKHASVKNKGGEFEVLEFQSRMENSPLTLEGMMFVKIASIAFYVIK